ncbi:MAG TPA: hypothetical protein VGR63_15350 [Casimicrobiaceae bacterium]|nr:hypothetical protein [Casimicrobiaceae bacterium]
MPKRPPKPPPDGAANVVYLPAGGTNQRSAGGTNQRSAGGGGGQPPRRPSLPRITALMLALERVGCRLSRDRFGIGYVAAPGFATRYHRVRLDGQDAPSLVRRIWDEAHRTAEGYVPAAPMSKALTYEIMAALRARSGELAPAPHNRRVARLAADRAVLDPGWNDWRCIEIRRDGWRILRHEPEGALFLRSSTLAPLPEPVRHRPGAQVAGAALQALFPTVRSDRLAVMLAGMAWSLVSGCDHVAFVLHGASDAGKSTLARAIRAVLDPNSQPYDGVPAHDTVRTLIASGAHDRVLGLDNVSTITREVADMLCQRLDGYGGGRSRVLHTNADLAIIHSSGPLVITGIAPLLGHADLADRALVIDVAELAGETARTKLESGAVQRQVDALLPELLGRLLDAAVLGLAGGGQFGAVPGFRNGAMAAFAQAAAPALGETAAGMAAMLAEAGRYQRVLAADAAPVASGILDMVASGPQEGLPLGLLWRGTAIALLAELAKVPSVRMDGDFPRNGSALQNELIRLRAVLETAGIRLVLHRAARASGPGGASRWLELWQADPVAAAAAELEPDGGRDAPARH